MSLLRFPSPERRLFRAVWSSPARKRATLELFERTEHETRHARLFRERAAELGRDSDPETLAHERNLELAAERSDLDAHGFLRANLYDELGEVAYVAMLHVAEKRAAQLFATHRDLLDDDARTQAVFAQILKDEAYHVAYTGKALERWRDQGRAHEVKAGLDAARGNRLLAALRRMGARSGTTLGRVLLILLPIAILLVFLQAVPLMAPFVYAVF